MKAKFIELFTDCFILILNMSLYMTILTSLIFGGLEDYFHQLFILIINFIYLIISKRIYVLIKPINKSALPYSIIVIFSLMYLLELPRYFIANLEGANILKTLLSGFSILSFLVILNNIFLKYKLIYGEVNSLLIILKTYVYLSILIVCISNFVLIIWLLGFVDLFNNPIPSGFSSLIDNNVDNLGAKYFSPLYLTVISAEPRIAGLATFSGASYEPHIAAHFVVPAMFILNGIKDISRINKIIYNLSFIVFIISGSSGTAALALFFVCAYFLIVNTTIRGLSSFLLVSIPISILFFLINDLDILEDIYIYSKLTNSSGSSEYSVKFLEYVISPNTIWGDGVFNVPYPYASVDNIGLIFSILIVCFYILGILASMLSIKFYYNNELLKFVGLGVLYFFLHSLKVVQLIFIFPFTIFMVYILYLSNTLKYKKY